MVTFAAGGLLVRDDGAVCLVHRPRYDDWAIPKGKLEPGETLVEAAVREVREETRCAVECGRYAGRYQYDADGPKGVFVWRMHLVDEHPPDAPEAGDEVDERAWVAPSDALDRLTYANERALVERVLVV
ncbi:8-oxo-dGTP diphosphatase [Halogranum rubrum]|uniref:8-oxo-dGTP diphosphatase n=1 Tax=Halogranum rubrum TaxID=553466 RepID=A0A1I4HEF0_9EURY|nr:NUDIX domain-containing protein [Halogranum rubrum]SFL40037.1 8-oxo-dGTP diphosphatase [Halogranum rubrum]